MTVAEMPAALIMYRPGRGVYGSEIIEMLEGRTGEVCALSSSVDAAQRRAMTAASAAHARCCVLAGWHS